MGTLGEIPKTAEKSKDKKGIGENEGLANDFCPIFEQYHHLLT